MGMHAFIHRHYSPALGESPTGHAAAVLGGLTLIGIGIALLASVVFIPAGVVIGFVGVMLLAGGLVAHIRSPFKLADAMDALVGLAGAAIAMTFMLAIFVTAVGLALTALFAAIQWLVR